MASIPAEIAGLKNWVCYELRANPDNPAKPKKIPLNPQTGLEAKSNDASTWGDYHTAIDRAKTLENGGVGFMFGAPGNPCGIAGIDLDDCFDSDDDGHNFLTAEANEIVSLMDSYTEYSPSGQGLHILFKLSRSLHELDASFNTGKKNSALCIEIYDSGRYFTFTGRVYGESKSINERTEHARQVIAKYFTQARPAKKQEPQSQTQITYNRPDESDAELWAKMFNNATNGLKIRSLYEGDISDYNGDDSSADLALCNHLAYYTNNDAWRIDRMFRESRLYRAKWDEMRGNQTYGEMTIQKAIAGTPEYIPSVKALTGDKGQAKSEQVSEPKPEIKFNSDSEYLASVFEEDIKHFQRYQTRKTGFNNLDERLTLYPGLYVIGAVSSLGKSTFCLQLADQLAQRGEHILFFAFEQTRFELVSKSLARLSQPEHARYDSNPSAIEIRKGRITPELREGMRKFQEISQHKQIIECDFMTDINVLKSTVNAYIQQYGVKPVIFVDYLQLIRSDNPKLTNAKDIVDENIRALKLLQMRNELVMFVVSSLNRQNYLTVIDFESFKESGAIEYTADVVIGLQLAVMSHANFNFDEEAKKASSLKTKRDIVKAAKREKTRAIELCILKNRYGVANASFYFHYTPKWDLFEEISETTAMKEADVIISQYTKDKKSSKPI